MSYEAIRWALRDAPGVPPECVSALLGLAHHADRHGRGAYPSAATLSDYTRKSERQVRYDLAKLTERGLIRLGDQALAEHLPVNRRTQVYDLPLELTRAALEVQPIAPQGEVQPTAPQSAGVQPAAPRQPIAPQTSLDLGELPGVQPIAPQAPEGLGCNTAQPGVQPIADKERTNPNPGSPVGTNSSGKTSASGKPGAQRVAPQREGKHAVADELAAAFWERHQSSTAQSFITLRGIIRTAISNGLLRDDVARALDRLARQGRAISGGTITTALAEIKGSSNGRPGSSAPGPDRARSFVRGAQKVQDRIDAARRELPE